MEHIELKFQKLEGPKILGKIDLPIETVNEITARKLKKRDWSKPLTKEEIYFFILRDYNKYPKEVLIEMLELDYLHKSPISLSFYSKKKNWDYTEDKTIRWSQHWNFRVKRDKKIHSITDISVPNDIWARGIYNEENKIFKIEKIYSNNLCTRDEYLSIKMSILQQFPNLNSKPSEDIINKRKNFAAFIKEGKVSCLFNGQIRTIIKFNNLKIKLLGDIIVDRYMDDKITAYNSFTLKYPDFALFINGNKYTKEMLKNENLY